jgi:hypothetical protein
VIGLRSTARAVGLVVGFRIGCMRPDVVDLLAGQRQEVLDASLSQLAKGDGESLARQVGFGVEPGDVKGRSCVVSCWRVCVRWYGGVRHIRLIRISDIGCSPPGLPYKDSAPRNRDRLRPESADIVMEG